MRPVKSFLQSTCTMTQGKLNHLMLLHVYRYVTDTLSLDNVANEFVSKSVSRLQVFVKFWSIAFVTVYTFVKVGPEKSEKNHQHAWEAKRVFVDSLSCHSLCEFLSVRMQNTVGFNACKCLRPPHTTHQRREWTLTLAWPLKDARLRPCIVVLSNKM